MAHHFLRPHPGDVTDQDVAGDTVRVPAEEVIQVIDAVDVGQRHGISRFAPGIVKRSLLDEGNDAELDRKTVAAMPALPITTLAEIGMVVPLPATSAAAAMGVELEPPLSRYSREGSADGASVRRGVPSSRGGWPADRTARRPRPGAPAPGRPSCRR